MSLFGRRLEQSGNFSRMINGELCRTVFVESSTLFYPGGHPVVRLRESCQHLAAGSESILYQFILGSERNDAPMIDDRDAIAEPLRFLHVVGCINHGDSLAVQPLDHFKDAVAG